MVARHFRHCDVERSSKEEEEEDAERKVEASASASASALSQSENQAQPEVLRSSRFLGRCLRAINRFCFYYILVSLGKKNAPFEAAVFKRKMGKMSAAATRCSKHPPVFASSDED